MNMLAQVEPTVVRTFPTLLKEAEFPILAPTQLRALERLEYLSSVTPIVHLDAVPGSGRSTILRTFARRYGGRIVHMADIEGANRLRDTRIAINAAVEYVEHLLSEEDLVIIDDIRDFYRSFAGVRGAPKQDIDGALFKNLFDSAIKAGKRLIIGSKMEVLPQTSRPGHIEVDAFTVEDYESIAANILGAERAACIDFKMVYRYASLLNGNELRTACQLVAHLGAPTTEEFVDGLETHVLAGNIRVEEIEALSFDSLPGAEHITSKLEKQVILPLEHRQLAQQLGIKPKRGVLLFGPPGTGKTSIGRALAHRMKGKFFLIDGSVVTEPPGPFFDKLKTVIREAKESAPSVLFIDDADVLFDIVHISGLARYLLTLLDGLETESASHVCVMMTAMDVRKVPEALLRSGRVELWLETTAPQGADRGRILQRWLGNDLPDYESVDYASLSDATDGFTPADLRRITGDAKCLFAADHVKGRALATANDYLHRAVGNLVAIRGRMADALGDDNLRVGGWRKQKYGLGVGGMAEMSVSCKTKGWD